MARAVEEPVEVAALFQRGVVGAAAPHLQRDAELEPGDSGPADHLERRAREERVLDRVAVDLVAELEQHRVGVVAVGAALEPAEEHLQVGLELGYRRRPRRRIGEVDALHVAAQGHDDAHVRAPRPGQREELAQARRAVLALQQLGREQLRMGQVVGEVGAVAREVGEVDPPVRQADGAVHHPALLGDGAARIAQEAQRQVLGVGHELVEAALVDDDAAEQVGPHDVGLDGIPQDPKPDRDHAAASPVPSGGRLGSKGAQQRTRLGRNLWTIPRSFGAFSTSRPGPGSPGEAGGSGVGAHPGSRPAASPISPLMWRWRRSEVPGGLSSP